MKTIANIEDAPSAQKWNVALLKSLQLHINQCRMAMNNIEALSGLKCPEMDALRGRLKQLEDAISQIKAGAR